jgi:peptidoglycan/xylan/chitin deacetylase (PgdA/CDA1 family)
MLRRVASSLLNRSGVAGAWQHLSPPRGVILMCHSVGDTEHGRFDPNARWRISAAQLEMAIQCACTMGYRSTTMDKITCELDQNDAPAFTLTFDDGYADNLYAALPICRRLQVPITTYVTSGFIERRHTAWWHLFAHLIAHQPALKLRLGGEVQNMPCASKVQKARAFDRIAAYLTHAAPAARALMLDEVDARYSDASRHYAQGLFLSDAELRKFAADDLVTIGVHGVSHSAMASLASDDARRELEQSRYFLHTATGLLPAHLAYPFGTPITTGWRDHELARQAGFSSAVTTRHGCLTGQSDAMALPRIPIFPDDTISSMRCKLSGLTTLLARLRRGR